MIARARRSDAATILSASRMTQANELWQEAVQVRREWFNHGLSTQPSDRATAERCLTNIYARIARPKPRFEWVDSPYKALPLVAGLPTIEELYRWVKEPPRSGRPPLASDLAMAAAGLRGALSEGLAHADPELTPVRRGKTKDPWPELPPLIALDQGVPLAVVLHQGIRAALYRSLIIGFCLPVRTALTRTRPMPVCWYGQQEASWVAYYDALRRLGLARYGPDETDHFTDWTDLTRSCGWWWPGDDACVVVERPAMVRTEQVPGTPHEQSRLGKDAVEYRDGWRPPLT
jgi:hypothetical protein